MKVLVFSQKYMTLCGISSHKLHDPTNEFYRSIVAYSIIFGLFALVAAAAVYIFNHFTDLDTTTNSYIVLSACGATAASFIAVGINIKSVKLFYIELQRLIDGGKIVIPSNLNQFVINYNFFLS